MPGRGAHGPRGTWWVRRWQPARTQPPPGAHVLPSGRLPGDRLSRGLGSEAGPTAATPTHRGRPRLDPLLMRGPHRSSDIRGRQHGSNLADRGRGSDPPRHRHGGAAGAGGQ